MSQKPVVLSVWSISSFNCCKRMRHPCTFPLFKNFWTHAHIPEQYTLHINALYIHLSSYRQTTRNKSIIIIHQQQTEHPPQLHQSWSCTTSENKNWKGELLTDWSHRSIDLDRFGSGIYWLPVLWRIYRNYSFLFNACQEMRWMISRQTNLSYVRRLIGKLLYRNILYPGHVFVVPCATTPTSTQFTPLHRKCFFTHLTCSSVSTS